MKKILLLLIVICFTFCGCTVNYDNENLTIHFLDVDQGDAIFITTPQNTKILIDGGPNNKILNELGQVMPFWDHNIDIMILTHPHADHVVGLVEVLRRYNVKTIYHTGVLHTAPDYLAWLKEVENQQIKTILVTKPINLLLDNNILLDFLYPLQDFSFKKAEELNNTSIVNLLTYGNTKFLFMGDAETPVEEELLNQNFELQSNVIKIGHHGSKSSTSEEFIKIVQPQYAIISAGQDNSFNHPHLITVRRLEKYNIKIFNTINSATITLKSDSEKIFLPVN